MLFRFWIFDFGFWIILALGNIALAPHDFGLRIDGAGTGYTNLSSSIPNPKSKIENPKSEASPIIERQLDFYDFTLKAIDGRPFNLREYGRGKRLILVSYVAGWCKNSNNNGHTVKQLYDRYHARGLGVVAVSEYSSLEELKIHVNRIGINYPVVIETDQRGARKKSVHYKYRHLVGDKRKWGTPFYVIIDARDIEPARPDGLFARRVYTVSGEIVESEADGFIEQKLADTK